jgi:glycosyltransferase involved in cell wall biosynthesis
MAAKTVTYGPLEGSPFILYVGNAYPYKNLERLVESFDLLDRPDYQLVLVGKKDYFYERLQTFIAQRGLKNVIFTGFVSDGQLAWLYQHAAAYVFPSLSEGFGLPGLEAMAAGLPVISSNATCLPEVYGSAAHYFNPHDSADMATKIREVLDDDKLRQQLISAGQIRVKDFSWERMARETLEVYREVLG